MSFHSSCTGGKQLHCCGRRYESPFIPLYVQPPMHAFAHGSEGYNPASTAGRSPRPCTFLSGILPYRFPPATILSIMRPPFLGVSLSRQSKRIRAPAMSSIVSISGLFAYPKRQQGDTSALHTPAPSEMETPLACHINSA